MKIRKGTADDFEVVYSDMEKQFPPSEMKTKEAFQSLIGMSDYNFYVIEEENTLCAYFMAFVEKESNMVLLDHFAVMRNFHGQGIGSETLELIKDHYALSKGLILEVEKPDPLRDNTLRRIKFYKNSGAYKIDLPYLLPNGDTIQPMDLYFINCNYKGIVSKEDVMEALKVVFENVHVSFENAAYVWQLLERSYSNGL